MQPLLIPFRYAGSPLALYLEARNQAGLPHPHHLPFKGMARNLMGVFWLNQVLLFSDIQQPAQV